MFARGLHIRIEPDVAERLNETVGTEEALHDRERRALGQAGVGMLGSYGDPIARTGRPGPQASSTNATIPPARAIEPP